MSDVHKAQSIDEFENWLEEKRSAYLYGIIAAKETDSTKIKLFLGLADAAEKQAAIWGREAHRVGKKIPLDYRPDFRTKIIVRLINWLGPHRLCAILASMKVRGMSVYLRGTIEGSTPSSVIPAEQQHSSYNVSNNLRAAVFGANDGLISNASLILGVAGSGGDIHFVIVSGIAGLLAGSCSMAAGEYVSVRSQREMLEYQIELERQELELYPEEEISELSLIYQARGLPEPEAERVARLLIQHPEKALDTLVREELGLNPNELVSPLSAAIFSFVSFAMGALIPLLPFLLSKTLEDFPFSILLVAISLFSIGAMMSLFTNRSALWGGLRMLLIGSFAGTTTYWVGYLLKTML